MWARESEHNCVTDVQKMFQLILMLFSRSYVDNTKELEQRNLWQVISLGEKIKCDTWGNKVLKYWMDGWLCQVLYVVTELDVTSYSGTLTKTKWETQLLSS